MVLRVKKGLKKQVLDIGFDRADVCDLSPNPRNGPHEWLCGISEGHGHKKGMKDSQTKPLDFRVTLRIS